jgi:hypothetical protein
MRFPSTVSALVIIVFSAVAANHAQTLMAIEREMVMRLDNISKYGTYAGNFDEDKIYAENEQFKAKLLSYGRRADVLRYSFPKLKEKMQVTTSRDGNLRIYSWDEETGGTMHDHDSVFQYRGRSGKIFSWAEKSDREDAGGFYHEIFQLDTPAGRVYLGVSTFIGSTSYVGQSIKVFKIEDDKLDPNVKLIRTGSGLQNTISFAFDFFSVVDRPERPLKLFKFDTASRTFAFPVVIEDEKTPQGRVTDKLIRYRFDGKYFVKVS